MLFITIEIIFVYSTALKPYKYIKRKMDIIIISQIKLINSKINYNVLSKITNT